jgi:hypothetical protein
MTSRFRRVSLGLALVFTSLEAQAQQGASVPGWTVTVNIATDFGDPGHGDTTTMRHRIADQRLRWEVVRVMKPSGPVPVDGMYVIVDMADSTMTTVMPAQRMATIVGLDRLGERRASLNLSTAGHLTRSDLEDLGDGGRILGHATRHYRLTTEGTTAMTVAGQTCSQRVNYVMEMWIAPDVDFGPISGAMSQHIGDGTGPADHYSMRTGVSRALLPKGTSLRTIIRQPGPRTAGRDITVTTTVETVEIVRAQVDVSTFSVPASIPTTDLRQRMAQLPPATVDSALKRGAAFMSTPSGKAMCNAGGR